MTLTLAACGANVPRATAAPTSAVSPTQAFVADLVAAGLSASAGGSLSSAPVGGKATLVCVGSETLQVYEFESVASREAMADRINPHDPSIVGNAIVDWIGQPHFWQRDRIIVLSVGGSDSLVGALTKVLGQPFAEGPPGGLQSPHNGCAST